MWFQITRFTLSSRDSVVSFWIMDHLSYIFQTARKHLLRCLWSEQTLVAVTYAAVWRLQGCPCCARPKQIDLPLYSSVSLSVCLSVTTRPNGIRLKGCISCLVNVTVNGTLQEQTWGVEGNEFLEMSSLEGSIIHEAALVTDTPVKRLSLSPGLGTKQNPNFDTTRFKNPVKLSTFQHLSCLQYV